MKLIDKDALSMELMNEVLNAYAKADFRFAHALNVFQGLIDKAPTTIRLIETNTSDRQNSVRLSTLISLAQALNVKVKDLFEEVKE